MHITRLLLLLPLVGTTTLCAQEVWTMDRCIAYAVSHAAEAQSASVNARLARTDVRMSLLDFLPSVEATSSMQYSWGRNIDPETNTYNNVTTFNNYYQVQASLTLFDGGKTINAYRRARLQQRERLSELDRIRDERAIDVMTKYVDAVYAAKTVSLMRGKLADSRALLAKTRRLYELGDKSRPDLVQMESETAKDDYNLLHQEHLARQTMMALRTAMHFPETDSLVIDTLIGSLGAIVPSRLPSDTLLESLPAISAARHAVETARLGIAVSRGALLPHLSVGGALGTNYYRNLSVPGNRVAFRDQLRNNFGQYLFLSLNIPLFNASAHRSLAHARAEYQLARIRLDEARRQASDAARQALLDYRGYVSEAESMRRKLASDSISWHLNVRKYDAGMVSVFDLHTLARTLQETRIRLLQTEMLLALKERLVQYYFNHQSLWISK